jgi:hypothetical protein
MLVRTGVDGSGGQWANAPFRKWVPACLGLSCQDSNIKEKRMIGLLSGW